jgi:hypothetical protein
VAVSTAGNCGSWGEMGDRQRPHFEIRFVGVALEGKGVLVCLSHGEGSIQYRDIQLKNIACPQECLRFDQVQDDRPIRVRLFGRLARGVVARGKRAACTALRASASPSEPPDREQGKEEQEAACLSEELC